MAKKSIEVADERIAKLQYSANGFRNSFFLVWSARCSNGQWDLDGDIMSVLGTTGCFSVELYLKLLMVIATFDPTTKMGNHIEGHKLNDLYQYLQNINPSFITDLENEFQKSKYTFNRSLNDFLKSIADYFVDWRYSYDKGALNVNLNTLCDTINILSSYSESKYLPIAQQLSASSISSQSDGQTMIISSFADIRNTN